MILDWRYLFKMVRKEKIKENVAEKPSLGKKCVIKSEYRIPCMDKLTFTIEDEQDKPNYDYKNHEWRIVHMYFLTCDYAKLAGWFMKDEFEVINDDI